MDKDLCAMVICMIIASALIVYFMRFRGKGGRRKKQDVKLEKIKDKNYNLLLFIQVIYSNAPFLRVYYRKVNQKVKLLYPADPFSIQKKTAEILMKGSIAGIGCILLTFVMSRGDVFFICAGLMITYLMFTSTITNGLKNMEELLMYQFEEALTFIRHQYNKKPIIEMAIHAAIDEMPYEIGLHMQNIYDILISPDITKKTDDYIGSEPNQYMLMFLTICSSVKQFGDKPLAKGNTLFLSDLGYLKEEVCSALLDMQKTKNMFSGHAVVSVLAILFIKPIQMWAQSIMPEIAAFYGGIYGVVCMIALFILSFLAYTIVVFLRDGSEDEEKDHDIWTRLAAVPLWSDFLDAVIEKNYTRYLRYDDALRGIGNHTGPKALLVKQISLAVGAFLLTVVLFFSSGVRQKWIQLKDWSYAFTEVSMPNEEYREIMRETGEEWLRTVRKETPDISKEELAAKIKAEDPNVRSDTYAEVLADEVLSRAETYKNSYFKFWYLLIAGMLGIIAFWGPIAMLKLKFRISEMRKQQEVILFQSLMMILMHINGVTLSTILEWMERFSYCFRDSISECRISILAGQEEALQAMKDRENYMPFRNFIDNLMAIDKVGVEKAFDEVQADREYSMKEREETMNKNRETRANWSAKLSMAPTWGIILFYLFIPLGMYMVQMLEVLSTSITM